MLEFEVQLYISNHIYRIKNLIVLILQAGYYKFLHPWSAGSEFEGGKCTILTNWCGNGIQRLSCGYCGVEIEDDMSHGCWLWSCNFGTFGSMVNTHISNYYNHLILKSQLI